MKFSGRTSDTISNASYSMSNSEMLVSKLLGRQTKEDRVSPEMKEQDEQKSSPELSHPSSSMHSDIDKRWDFNMWHSVGPIKPSIKVDDEKVVIRTHSQQHLGANVEMVYNLQSMFDMQNREEMAKSFLAMSSTPENCNTIRQSGYLPLLVQLIHAQDESKSVRKYASQALHNIVHHHTNDKQGRREAHILKLVEQILDYCDKNDEELTVGSDGQDTHPSPIIATLSKWSFDEEYRLPMCQLGALHAIAKLVQRDHEVHSDIANIRPECASLRRYAEMVLTNLTYRDATNKALLCSFTPFMSALIAQLDSPNEDLCQVTASVLRNLSWRADAVSKQTLRDLGTVTALMKTALRVKNESSLKAILSALWNFSAHCNLNKIDICSVDGAVEYLVEMLKYPSIPVVENAGGVLRNVSSHIAVREDYRSILRKNNCLKILIEQLKSNSLTIVSNACGTLWNLSAYNSNDQRALWQLGAVPMLRSLTHSKHKTIAHASSGALKNLMSSCPDSELFDVRNKSVPKLAVRKRRAMEQDLDGTVTETCDNLEQWDAYSTAFKYVTNSSAVVTDTDSVVSGGSEYAYSRLSHGISDRSINSNVSVNTTGDEENVETPSTGISDKDINGKDCASGGIADKNIEIGADEAATVTISRGISSSIPTNVTENKNAENDAVTIIETCVAEENEKTTIGEPDKEYRDKKNEEIKESGQGKGSIDDGVGLNNKVALNVNDTVEEFGDLKISDENVSGAVIKEDAVNMDHDANEIYGDYAETDLDTGLRYCEQDDTVMTYCTEGTPYTFSSANSLLDLRQSVAETPPKDVEDDEPATFVVEKFDSPSPADATTGGGKAEEETSITKDNKNVAETPMMFSRSSSLGSISSCGGEHPDDRSSVVSEFSRLASGMISPSELPDSPTQSVPPSPHPSLKGSSMSKCGKSISSDKPERSVFEDSVTVFKDESTPLHFSTATSLSSLTFDDDIHAGVGHLPVVCEQSTEENSLCLQENTTSSASDTTKVCFVSPVMREDAENQDGSSVNTTAAATMGKQTSLNEDSVVNFCTEDTPASISHAASHSDLSILCLSDDSFLQSSNILPLSSSCNDDGELPLEVQKMLLNECIATGLKTLNTTFTIKTHTNVESKDSRPGKAAAFDVSEEISLEEQKMLLKKYILAGIDSVVSSGPTAEKATNVQPDATTSSTTNKELSEEEQKMLLQRCIAVGLRNMKDSSCDLDLDNIGPPSFLAEANLESSLTNVDSIMSEIADTSPTLSAAEDLTLVDDKNLEDIVFPSDEEVQKDRINPKQRRIREKERYGTYTINTHRELQNESNNSAAASKAGSVCSRPRKSFIIKERRSAEKDRFRTRTFSNGDYQQIVEYESQKNTTETSRVYATNFGSESPIEKEAAMTCEEYPHSSDADSHEDQGVKAKVTKPVDTKKVRGGQKVKSGIPVVNKVKTPPSKVPTNAKSKIPTKLPTPLQRQGTFTKDSDSPTQSEQQPSPSTTSKPDAKSTPVSSKQDPQKDGGNIKRRSGSGRMSDAKNRWSISDNSINNVSSLKAKSNSSTNLSSGPTCSSGKLSSNNSGPAAAQSKKEVTSKIAGIWKKSEEGKSKKETGARPSRQSGIPDPKIFARKVPPS